MNYWYNGERLNMICWKAGQGSTGNYWSDRWFKVEFAPVGGQYYMHSSLVADQTTVGRCP